MSDIVTTTPFNKIYIIGGITEEATENWLKDLDQAEFECLGLADRLGVSVPLTFEISSYGGDARCSFALGDRIARLRVPTVTLINGYAASGGTLISMVGDTRLISRNSFMLTHQYSGLYWGTHENLKDHMEGGDKLMDAIVNFYVEHSKLSRKKIKKLLKRDKWLTAQECLKYGFVDAII